MSQDFVPINAGMLVPSHFLYADDIFLFCRGTKSNIKAVVEIFKVYGEISDQLVNWEKSY